MIHTVKGFGIVNKAEVDAFLELSFSMIQAMLAIWSLWTRDQIALSEVFSFIWKWVSDSLCDSIQVLRSAYLLFYETVYLFVLSSYVEG